MSEIEKRDVEAYIRNLISKNFRSNTDQVKQNDRPQRERSPDAPFPKGSSRKIQQGRNIANGT